MHDTEKKNKVNGDVQLCQRWVNSFAIAHVSETDIPILSQLIQHLNFPVLADVCDNYSYSVFVINIFWADLNKWLHVGVFHAFADKLLAEQ